MFILRLASALDTHKIPYAVVGGYAVALHGAVRGTVDIDLVIRLDEKNLLRAEEVLNGLGLESRIPVGAKEIFQFRHEYISRRNLIAWSFVNPRLPSEVVDILITKDLRDIKTVSKNFGKTKIRIVSIPDLIAMKKESARPQDLEDIKALEKLK